MLATATRTRTMDPEVKGEWTRALRSGEYRQGTGLLRAEGKFCCLGVLCDLVDPEGWDDPICHAGVVPSGHAHRIHDDHGESDADQMPSLDLLAKVGLSVANASQISWNNDEKGDSFEVIADWIEEHL